jgi:hypothetical protein
MVGSPVQAETARVRARAVAVSRRMILLSTCRFDVRRPGAVPAQARRGPPTRAVTPVGGVDEREAFGCREAGGGTRSSASSTISPRWSVQGSWATGAKAGRPDRVVV